MYQNITETRVYHNPDGTTTVRQFGVETFPQVDAQGDPIAPATTGGSVEPTVTDPAIVASFVSAAQQAAQANATANNVRVRLNGSATEYVKPA